ncbi:(2Fe-2S)-binding protein [candidate division KSB1 bacterium]|nr:(2Fe-2S)-binding protein [candidate division KSB1 bacterium]
MRQTIQFTLNSKAITLKIDGERSLLAVLRSDLGLTGTKYGCGESLCGACTVLINGEAVRSCQYQMSDVAGKSVMTIEGLEQNGKLHPLQQAFMDHDALQCGYCTPGMILTAYELLNKNPEPTQEDIIAGLEDNLCRCGAHQRIVRAVQDAAKQME